MTRFLDGCVPVCGRHDGDVCQSFDPVHLCQHLSQHPVAHLATPSPSGTAPLPAQGVDLVEEDNGRRHSSGAVEEVSHRLLGLANPFAEQLRAFDGHEVQLGLVGQGLKLIQWCMTFTDMRLTENMGLTEKSATTEHFM